MHLVFHAISFWIQIGRHFGVEIVKVSWKALDSSLKCEYLLTAVAAGFVGLCCILSLRRVWCAVLSVRLKSKRLTGLWKDGLHVQSIRISKWSKLTVEQTVSYIERNRSYFTRISRGLRMAYETPANHVWDVGFGDQSFHIDSVTQEQPLSCDQAASRTKGKPHWSVCQT